MNSFLLGILSGFLGAAVMEMINGGRWRTLSKWQKAMMDTNDLTYENFRRVSNGFKAIGNHLEDVSDRLKAIAEKMED